MKKPSPIIKKQIRMLAEKMPHTFIKKTRRIVKIAKESVDIRENEVKKGMVDVTPGNVIMDPVIIRNYGTEMPDSHNKRNLHFKEQFYDRIDTNGHMDRMIHAWKSGFNNKNRTGKFGVEDYIEWVAENNKRLNLLYKKQQSEKINYTPSIEEEKEAETEKQSFLSTAKGLMKTIFAMD